MKIEDQLYLQSKQDYILLGIFAPPKKYVYSTNCCSVHIVYRMGVRLCMVGSYMTMAKIITRIIQFAIY